MKPHPQPSSPSRSASRRITGLETEYGCLVEPPLQVTEVIRQVRDWMFEQHRFGLVDRHDRDWDEPAGNGGFLFNGGRIYLDMGHLEYCTAECASTVDVVRYDRAGDTLLLEALKDLGLSGQVGFIRNNIDHHTGATFGCHENYSLLRGAPLSQRNVLSLLTFLTLRAVYCGAGRVGASPGSRLLQEENAARDTGIFQITQRADYIQNDFFEWVQHNRAIINTRDEPLADPRHYRRLHLIHGDTNVLPSALFLKVGTTRLVFDLLEADDLPEVALLDAVASLRQISRTVSPPWLVRLADGSQGDALGILSEYQARADRRFRGRDIETDAVLAMWGMTLRDLERDKSRLVGRVDWVTKEHMFELFREAEGIGWGHPWLEAQDLEYHNIHPDRSLALPLADMNGVWGATGGDDACCRPPPDTRAAARHELMSRIRRRGGNYVLDWDSVQVEDGTQVYLLDPFLPTPPDE